MIALTRLPIYCFRLFFLLLFNFFMWYTLNSEICLRCYRHLVCNRFPCAITALNLAFVWNLPDTFEDNLCWQTWRQMNLVLQDFFSFGVYHFFKTVGWHRVVEDDSVGFRLPKNQSSNLRTFQVDPIHCILVHFPLRSERYHPWPFHVVGFVFLWFVHGIHCCEEYGLSSLF